MRVWPRLWPRTLAAQITLLTVAALIAAQVAGVVLFSAERGLAWRQARLAEAADRAGRLAALLPALPPAQQPGVLAVAGSAGMVFALADAPLSGGAADRAGQVVPLPGHGQAPPGLGWLRDWAMAMGLAPAELHLSQPLPDGRWLNLVAQVHRPGAHLPPQILATSLLSVLGLVLAIRAGLTRVTRPLRRLAQAADAFGLDRDPPPLPETGPAELQAMAQALRRMHARLTGMVADRTRMLAALGHDLRTPITALRLRAELVEDDETRDRMAAILDEMQDMTEATLAYARGVSPADPPQPGDPFALLADLAAELARPGAPVTLQPGLPAAVMPQTLLPMRRLPLRRALRNLIENAQRHGGGAVHLSGVLHPDRAELRITDDGPGIPPADLARVFQPFERLEISRSRDTGGSGLGLPIARDILRAHGGDVELTNRPGGGLCATVTLPRHQGAGAAPPRAAPPQSPPPVA